MRPIKYNPGWDSSINKNKNKYLYRFFSKLKMSKTDNDNYQVTNNGKAEHNLKTIVDDELTRAGNGGPWVW